MNYRDMTFCNHWKNCAKAEFCPRALTPEIATAARKWWGADGAPIAVFVEQPKCHAARVSSDDA
jgi:hypothetical protein